MPPRSSRRLKALIVWVLGWPLLALLADAVLLLRARAEAPEVSPEHRALLLTQAFSEVIRLTTVASLLSALAIPWLVLELVRRSQPPER